jgi:hypothetical protein
MPVIPATWEVEIGGLWSKASLGKNVKLYLKNKLNKRKEKLYSTCLASKRS